MESESQGRGEDIRREEERSKENGNKDGKGQEIVSCCNPPCRFPCRFFPSSGRSQEECPRCENSTFFLQAGKIVRNPLSLKSRPSSKRKELFYFYFLLFYFIFYFSIFICFSIFDLRRRTAGGRDDSKQYENPRRRRTAEGRDDSKQYVVVVMAMVIFIFIFIFFFFFICFSRLFLSFLRAGKSFAILSF